MSNQNKEVDQVLLTLKDPHTIRVRSHHILDFVKENRSEYFALNPERLTSTASLVIDVINENYPNLNIPYHSRWRHFEVDGINRIEQMQQKLNEISAAERGKILFELVIISVLLDAGAGPSWSYTELDTEKIYSRSEGLALASLALYKKGILSTNPSDPLRVDAQCLLAFNEEQFKKTFQITDSNHLDGILGRVHLLNRLGLLVQQNSQYFGKEGRLGNFYTYISSLAIDNQITAKQIFQTVLDAFNNIWPTRILYQGIPLGDVWRHHALKTIEPGSELIPFHKLSQWLTYSLIEPLEQAKIIVSGLDELTGLPEYRNGGLLIDSDLLHVKNLTFFDTAYTPDCEIIVEWRALTIALLDELAELIRKKLQKTEIELPLAKILQGGTWEAGRRIAKQKRPQGTPPLQITSDGTVF